ncbi:DUF6056 family protein [Streptomyces sp. NPDC058257]|uniref:DUF6056 family protein n=1 Tax=Streptomyces sp. NPDC058257 TaxID=3346409 RepID=UPI0036F02A20
MPKKAARDQRGGVVPEPRRPWWRTSAPLGLLSLLPLAVFAFAAWNARWVRPGGDDWCFLPVVRDGGLPAMAEKFYFHDNGRIVNAVLVWAYARFGEPGQQWFAPISGVLVIALLWAFIAAALHVGRLRAPRGVGLLVASMVTALFLFGSPNTYKTFYWPAASVSHTLPPVFACAAAVPVLRATSRRGKALALLTVVLTGACLGLLSEETSVVTATVLAFALLISSRAFPAARRRFLRVCCAAGIASTVMGILILYTSPGAMRRRERKHASTMLTPDSLIGSLRGFGEIIATLLTTWPYAGAIVVGLVLGLVTASGASGRIRPGRTQSLAAVAGVCALLVSGYVCTVITYPVFGKAVVSSTRLWNDYLLLYILLLVYVGALAGRAWGSRAQRTTPVLATGALLNAAVCIALAASLAGLASDMTTRAQDWDRQNRSMRSQAAAGVQVLSYKRLPLSHMTEPFRHHGHAKWPAECIARYYHVQRITQAAKLP